MDYTINDYVDSYAVYYCEYNPIGRSFYKAKNCHGDEIEFKVNKIIPHGETVNLVAKKEIRYANDVSVVELQNKIKELEEKIQSIDKSNKTNEEIAFEIKRIRMTEEQKQSDEYWKEREREHNRKEFWKMFGL